MQLTPRYGSSPILVLDVAPGAVADAAIRQRARLGELLAGLPEAAWSHPTRCDGWAVRDVVSHLASTNSFWTMSVRAGAGGTPTTFLSTFDPVATPAALARADAEASPRELLERYTTSAAELAAALRSLDEAGWRSHAEAPAGHIAIDAVVHHALWDSWVHERDLAVPLGFDTATEDDEVAACLLFAAALGPAIAACGGSSGRGTLVVRAADAGRDVVVEVGDAVRSGAVDRPAVGDLVLTGPAVELIDVLSVRAPLPDDVVEHPAVWLLGGLRTQFDQPLG